MHCFSHGDPALRRALSPRAICQLDRRAGGGIGRQLTAVSRSPQGWRWLSCPVLTRSHGTSLAPIRSPTGAGQVTGPPYRGGGQNLGRHPRALLHLAPLRSLCLPRISQSGGHCRHHATSCHWPDARVPSPSPFPLLSFQFLPLTRRGSAISAISSAQPPPPSEPWLPG
jgi:hypothetical protein